MMVRIYGRLLELLVLLQEPGKPDRGDWIRFARLALVTLTLELAVASWVWAKLAS